MAFDYDEARASALEIISEYGAPGSVVKKGTTGGFDDNGDPKADVPDIVISGIVTPLLPFSTQTMKNSYELPGSNILAGDVFFFFHSETAPEVDYQHTQNGSTYRIIALLSEITSVDGVNVYRKFQLRK